MKLYTTDRAPNPERVKFFLAEKGITDKVERVETSIMDGSHRTPEYRAKSPFGHVPALELDDGRVLTESRAICTYLEGLHPEPNLMGTSAEERAFIEMWDRRMEFQILLTVAMWVRHGHPLVSQLEGPDACPEWAQTNEKRTRKMFQWLDRHLSGSEFVAGDRFTIADITAFVACGFVRLMKFNPIKEHEHIGAWVAKLKSRAMAEALG